MYSGRAEHVDRVEVFSHKGHKEHKARKADEDSVVRSVISHRGRFMAGAPPQTPKAGQSLVIAWRSGYGVEPHLKIIFVFSVSFVAKTTSVSPCPVALCET